MTAPQISSDVQVRTNLAEVPKVYGSPGQLTQVFINLVNNAAQAVKAANRAQGVLLVSTKVEGEHVLINIVDNGVGIADTNNKRIFEIAGEQHRIGDIDRIDEA